MLLLHVLHITQYTYTICFSFKQWKSENLFSSRNPFKGDEINEKKEYKTN